MIEIRCGRCEKCGGQEAVAYDPIRTKTEDGTVCSGWQAVVMCMTCRAQRVYQADQITDFRLNLEVIPTQEGGAENAGDDGGAVQPG